jgi:hypothetical protein
MSLNREHSGFIIINFADFMREHSTKAAVAVQASGSGICYFYQLFDLPGISSGCYMARSTLTLNTSSFILHLGVLGPH